MPTPDELFLTQRRFLHGLAYRLLGCAADTEDVLQDAWLRWRAQDTSTIDNPRAWLARVVTHLALDQLRRRRRGAADYSGPWLPEPLPTTEPAGTDDASTATELAGSLSLALLVLLERLTPNERATFVLRHAFDFNFDTIAACLGARPATCRQWLKRARERLGPQVETVHAPRAERALLERFVAAIAQGDEAALLDVLGADVTLTSDGGGKVSAVSKPVAGARTVARLLLGLAAQGGASLEVALAPINESWALVVRDAAGVASVISVHGTNTIERIYIVRNPDKLRTLTAAATPRSVQ